MNAFLKTMFLSLLYRRGYLLRKIGDSYSPPRNASELIDRVGVADIPGLRVWGSDYGGWPMLDTILPSNPICYCFGSGTDISFELEVAYRIQTAEVHLFDPTPSAIRHVEESLDALQRNEIATSCAAGDSYPYPKIPDAKSRVFFHPWGVSDEDGMQTFHPPADPTHVSHSFTNREELGIGFSAACCCLQTIASRLNHKNVDCMKFDVEGAEYQVIRSFERMNIRPKYLAFEFHPCDSFAAGSLWGHILSSIRILQGLGYALVSFDKIMNAVFLRVY